MSDGKKSEPKPGENTPSPSLEEAVGRLESLVEEMESSQLPLETLILRYEEGVRLLQVCQEKLAAAEQKIQIITKQAKGQIALEDFATGNDE
jgi:exodeoxyribonuclease VII small subunit